MRRYLNTFTRDKPHLHTYILLFISFGFSIQVSTQRSLPSSSWLKGPHRIVLQESNHPRSCSSLRLLTTLLHKSLCLTRLAKPVFSVNLFKPIISNLSVEKVGENVQIHLEIQQTKLFSSDSDQKDTLIKDLSTTFPLSMILCNWIAFVHFCVSLTLFALLCSPTLCIFRHVLCALQPCARCQCTGDVQRWMRAPPV